MGFLTDWFRDLAEQAVLWVIETTAAMIVMILSWILDSPDGALSAPAMEAMIAQGIAVGRYLLPLMVLLGVIQAGIHAQPGAIARLVFVELPLVAAFMVLIAPATGVVMAASDALTLWVLDEAAVASLQSAFSSLPTTAALSLSFLPIVGVLSLLAMVMALLLWAMMLMRNLGVVLSVVIGPGMLATRLWPAAKGWAARWVALLVALILVKPVIGFMLSLSMVVMASGIDPAAGFVDMQALAMGLLAFVAAALVPSFMFKFVPQVGEAVQGRLSSGVLGTTLTVASVGASAIFAAKSLGAGAAARGGAAAAGGGGVPLSPSGQRGGGATPVPPSPQQRRTP